MTTIIYLHGLDADPNANKAVITANHSQALGVQTIRPDLNCPPDEVVNKLLNLIEKNPDSVLIGSSLGGYFATLLSDLTGVSCVLLNPSIRPDLSFRRFLSDNFDEKNLSKETVIYTTTGGWQIKFGDLAWFEAHRLQIKHPSHQAVFLSMDDELLDAWATQEFYADKGVKIFPKATGAHRMEDYDERVGQVLQVALALGGD